MEFFESKNKVKKKYSGKAVGREEKSLSRKGGVRSRLEERSRTYKVEGKDAKRQVRP